MIFVLGTSPQALSLWKWVQSFVIQTSEMLTVDTLY